MSKSKNDTEKEKRKRGTNMDERETELFVDILKHGDEGKLWKVIHEGTANKTERHAVWLKVANIFSKETGKPFTFSQAKSKWGRIKDALKKKHDKFAVDREFRKQCSKTGGGAPPQFPPVPDVDDEGDELLIDDLDPADTNFNSLVRPEDRMSTSAGGQPGGGAVGSQARGGQSGGGAVGSQARGGQSGVGAEEIPVRGGSRLDYHGGKDSHSSGGRSDGGQGEVDQLESHFSNYSEVETPRSPRPTFLSCFRNSLVTKLSSPVQRLRQSPLALRANANVSGPSSPMSRVQAGTRSPSSLVGITSFSSAEVSQDEVDPPLNIVGEEEAVIIDGSGNHSVIQVEKDSSRNPKAVSKIKNKSTIKDATSNYYIRMLEMQEDLAGERMKVLKLKQRLLTIKIRNEELKSPMLSEGAGSRSDSEGEDSNGNCGAGEMSSEEDTFETDI